MLCAIELSSRKVEILGIPPQSNGPWMEQIARNVSGEGGFLVRKKHLIHDRDPLFTEKLESICTCQTPVWCKYYPIVGIFIPLACTTT